MLPRLGGPFPSSKDAEKETENKCKFSGKHREAILARGNVPEKTSPILEKTLPIPGKNVPKLVAGTYREQWKSSHNLLAGARACFISPLVTSRNCN